MGGMIKTALLLFLLVACVASVQTTWTDAQFTDALGKGKVFAKFYAPWCGHCNKLAPVWEEVTNSKVLADKNVSVVKIDCDESEELCNKYSISSYPSVILFHDGKAEHYAGDRSRDSLIDFARTTKPTNAISNFVSTVKKAAKEAKQALKYEKPPGDADLTTLFDLNPKTFNDQVSKNTWILFLTYGGNGFDKDWEPIVHYCASRMKTEYPFIHLAKVNVLDTDIATNLGISEIPAVVFVHDGAPVLYTGSKRAWKPLLTFLEDEAQRSNLTPANAPAYYKYRYQIPRINEPDCIHGFTPYVCMKQYPTSTFFAIFFLGFIFGWILKTQGVSAPSLQVVEQNQTINFNNAHRQLSRSLKILEGETTADEAEDLIRIIQTTKHGLLGDTVDENQREALKEYISAFEKNPTEKSTAVNLKAWLGKNPIRKVAPVASAPIVVSNKKKNK